MKVRKTAIALFLIITFTGSLWEDTNKVIATVTNEKNDITSQSTEFVYGEISEGYILQNTHKNNEVKEYLNAYFTYNQNGLYVDGTDGVPLELFKKREGYLSVGFQHNYLDTRAVQVLEIGDIDFTLSEDKVYWKVWSDKGVYQTTKEELDSTEYVKSLLPGELNGLKGFMTLQEGKNQSVSVNIDIVPTNQDSNGNIFGIMDSIPLRDLSYNKRLTQYIEDSLESSLVLMVAANYNFKVNLPMNTISKDTNANMVVEGKITFTMNYNIMQ